MILAGQRKSSPAYTLYRLFWTAIDWLYPPTCPGCQKSGDRWCVACQNAAIRLGAEICPLCGDQSRAANICARCSVSRPAFAGLRSWGVHTGPLREAIHQLKYQRNIGLGECLAVHLVQTFLETGWQADLVCPVPLSTSRLHERGYNQAAELARPFSLALRIAYRPKLVTRIRDTRPQVGLNAQERQQNTRDAFRADPQIVQGRSVLMIDDVATTGATLSSCAEAVLNAGARQVFGLTLARAAFINSDLESPPGA
jgi:competence protein ComFC